MTSYTDLAAASMRSVCSDMAARNHTDCDCFLFVIMSHGEEGVVYGTDTGVEIKGRTADLVVKLI